MIRLAMLGLAMFLTWDPAAAAGDPEAPAAAGEAASAPAVEAPLPPAEAWIPGEAVIALRVAKPAVLLDQLLSPALIESIKASPVFKAQSGNPGFRQFLNIVRVFERRMEMDWQAGLRRLIGGGATLAIGPGGETLLVVDALDADALKGLAAMIVFLAQMDAAGKGQADRVQSSKVGDVTLWSLGPEEAHAIIGRRLLLSNRTEVLKAALGLRDGTRERSLAAVPAYRQAAKAAGEGAAAMLYADTTVLRQAPSIAKAFEADREPLAAMLAAPVLESLARSSWLALALKVGEGEVALDAISDGAIAEGGVSRFAIPLPGGAGARPNLKVPRRIAALTLYRDLHGFYAAKDDLFPERSSGLIFFENMMGIFFTGRSLTEEVFAEIGPQVRLVVAEQAYDPVVGTPAVRYPAFALVAPLKHPATYKRVLEEAWQKAVGLVNFTRGQSAEPGLVIDRPVHAGTKYTVAGFSPVEAEDRSAVDVRFNFEPALAMPGDWLILSSTGALARDLIDALGREGDTAAGAPAAGTHTLFELDGPQLASILESNRDNLVRNNMVEEGKTREEAAAGIDLLLAVARHIRGVTLAMGADAGRATASLRVRFGRPTVESGGP